MGHSCSSCWTWRQLKRNFLHWQQHCNTVTLQCNIHHITRQVTFFSSSELSSMSGISSCRPRRVKRGTARHFVLNETPNKQSWTAHVGFVVEKWYYYGFSSSYLGFPLTTSFHQCFIHTCSSPKLYKFRKLECHQVTLKEQDNSEIWNGTSTFI